MHSAAIMTDPDLNRARTISIRSKGVPTSDGAGVKLTRIIGTEQINNLDPFLLLDRIESDQSTDYIGGFPTHPHRGFETVTYLLQGNMRHKDNTGHEGVIESGGVQWMTAGKGILHSEMPEQEQGVLHGFQLWVNLPARDKMTEPLYQEFTAAAIPSDRTHRGVEIKVIAGKTNQGIQGPVINEYVQPQFFDIHVKQGHTFEHLIDKHDTVFIYLINGKLAVADNQQKVDADELAVLEQGERVVIRADHDSQFLLLAAKPLNEPIARGGPFVMNTQEQVLQAFDDFQNNRF